jgi:SprT protein
MKTTHLPIHWQHAVMECLRHFLQLANQQLNTDYPLPSVSYQQRGTSAGSAYLQHWQIRINPVLLLENQQAFIAQVVPHELAHLLTYRQFGRVAPHGKEWRWMMAQILGVEPSRTHQFAITSVQSVTYPYHCACREHQLTVRRHNRVLRQQAQYRCRHCGETLQPGITALKQ